jgi:pimeloyl-ACP methyl ester carboxylesterase
LIRHPLRRRARSVVTGLAGVAAGLIAAHYAIEGLAAWNVRREQKDRAWLGDRLYTEVVGDGEPLVALAGLQGTTRYWNHALDQLRDRYRVIYVDALGFGRSPWPHDITLQDHLGALDRTLQALNVVEPLTFVAHSFGSVLAAWFAARNRDRVRHLYLLGAPIYHDAADARARIHEMSPMAAAFSLNPILARESCNLVCAVRPLSKIVARVVRPDLHPDVAEDSMLHHWPSIRAAMDILQHNPIATALRQYGGRVTFIHGLADTITPLERVRALAAEIGADIITVDTNHQGYVERSRQIITAARERPASR